MVFLVSGHRTAGRAQGAPHIQTAEIEVSHPELVDALRRGDRVLLDDGRIELLVRSVDGRRAECSVVGAACWASARGSACPAARCRCRR